MRGRSPRLALIAVLAVSLWPALMWGRARPVAEISGTLAAPVAGEDSTVAWVDRQKDGDHLMVKRGRGAAREALSSPTIGGLVVTGDRIITSVAGSEGGPARLQSLNLGGAEWRELAQISAPAREVTAGNGWICWLMQTPEALPAAPFVTAGGAATVISAMPGKGGPPTVVAVLLAGQEVALLGAWEDRVYWAERHRQGGGAVTLIRARGVRGGEIETLVQEPGARSVVLLPGRLAWTAPSEESYVPEEDSSAKVMSLPGGQPKAIADWLARDVTLLVCNGTLYAQEQSGLWRLGGQRGDQELLYPVSFGGQMPAVVGDTEYLPTAFTKRVTLMKRGLTWGARLRTALGL